ncbi:unnamed protein product [Clonostachys rosea]|uniref:Zn(2)-C6 fungal-type domain-containing protein n=1 Tax=Bionectria ochroleuca TaxID=29856 RepID=A0ABY6UN83_BIOOC|nr:unnamed protein product [Clonostachys rosea]
MNEAEARPVIFCVQCNKPFNKQSTLKRHGYYCRTRRGGITTRARSCMSCARAKASCDNRRPQCSRCLGKGLACQYPATKASRPGPVIHHSDDAPLGVEAMTPSSVANTPSADGTHEAGSADAIIDGTLVLPDVDFANLGAEHAEWGHSDLELVADVGLIADFLNVQGGNSTYLSPASSSFLNHSTPPTSQSSRPQPDLSPPRFSIPASPSASVRSLIQRPKRTAASRRITNLILHTLKSYPLIMLLHKALPPFIHPSMLSSNLESDMEPLSNCISLMHMIGGQAKGTRKLFWKNVAIECHRFAEEASLPDWVDERN